MHSFLTELRTQRWDDHRYYHHSRINQSLHFLSAITFIVAYALMFKDPVFAALLGWLVAMVSRQSGHFFFEPKGYDEVNQATHEYKERIKIGYNLRRKVILHVVWALAPVLLWLQPTLFGLFQPYSGGEEFLRARGRGLARRRRRRAGVSHGALVLLERRADRPRLVHQDRHRSVQRCQALLQSAALFAARRTHRSQGREAARLKHFSQDAAFDGLVAQLRIRPPPAVGLHGLSGRDDEVGDGGEVRLRVIETENQASRPNPAQGKPRGPQVILKHPVVTRGAGCTRWSRWRTGSLHVRAGRPLRAAG